MGDFEFGSQEHIDGLSRKALEADFRFVVDRMREAEGEWERLEAENEKLRALVADMWHDGMCSCDEYGPCAKCEYHYPDRMRELRIEV